MIIHRIGFQTAAAVAAAMIVLPVLSVQADNLHPINTPVADPDGHLTLIDATATQDSNSTIIFKQTVAGTADGTVVNPFGQFDGAPVLGHVFPTTLKSSDIGFQEDGVDVEGIVALAITKHPDFDDTPLADEDNNGDPTNKEDGGLIHSHWVVLVDGFGNAALAVKPLDLNDPSITKPTTHPNLPVFIDSPNFNVKAEGNMISVEVPLEAVNNRTDFKFEPVTAYMETHDFDVHGDPEPFLGVYMVYSLLGDLDNLQREVVVPEPGSAAVMALGLLALASRKRFRQTA